MRLFAPIISNQLSSHNNGTAANPLEYFANTFEGNVIIAVCCILAILGIVLVVRESSASEETSPPSGEGAADGDVENELTSVPSSCWWEQREHSRCVWGAAAEELFITRTTFSACLDHLASLAVCCLCSVRSLVKYADSAPLVCFSPGFLGISQSIAVFNLTPLDSWIFLKYFKSIILISEENICFYCRNNPDS